MATATIEPNVPHVYLGLAEILRTLGVEKNGQLPQNMGGKPYIAAVDVAQEVKNLLVANSLIVLPNERVVKHEVVLANNRLTVAVAIEGEYTFVSTVDGSSAAVQGVGDGLANGNAVASNIASTNAMKNALLRAFMITEQSVEDQAKNGTDESPANTPKAVAAATKSASKGAVPAANEGIAKIREEIKAAVDAVVEATGVKPNYAAIGARLGAGNATWANDPKVLTATLAAIQAGEVK
jgi:hypothetical protein